MGKRVILVGVSGIKWAIRIAIRKPPVTGNELRKGPTVGEYSN